VASSGIVTVQSLRPTVYLRGKGRMMGSGGQISARPGHPRSKIGLAPRGECRGGRARVRGHSLSGYQMPCSDDIAVVVLELQPIRHVDRNARGEVRRRENRDADLPVSSHRGFTSRGADLAGSDESDDDGLEAEGKDRRSECRRCREHGYIERGVDQEGHEAEESPEAPRAVRARGEEALGVQGVQRLSARSSAF